MTITLVAMSRGGDAYISRDARGIVRHHHRYLPGDPLEIGAHEADRLISSQGYAVLDEEFATWTEVDTFTEARVPKLSPHHVVISARLAKALLPDLREAATDPARCAYVPATIARLLAEPAVFNETELREQLLTILQQSSFSTASASIHLGVQDRMRVTQSYYDIQPAA